MYPPKPFDISRTGPFRPKLKRSSYVYILEENTNQKPAGDMEVILVTDVDGRIFIMANYQDFVQIENLDVVHCHLNFHFLPRLNKGNL